MTEPGASKGVGLVLNQKAIVDYTMSIMAVTIIVTLSIVVVLGHPIPDILIGTVGTIIGVYFGRVSVGLQGGGNQTEVIAAASAAAAKAATDAMIIVLREERDLREKRGA